MLISLLNSANNRKAQKDAVFQDLFLSLKITRKDGTFDYINFCAAGFTPAIYIEYNGILYHMKNPKPFFEEWNKITQEL